MVRQCISGALSHFGLCFLRAQGIQLHVSIKGHVPSSPCMASKVEGDCMPCISAVQILSGECFRGFHGSDTIREGRSVFPFFRPFLSCTMASWESPTPTPFGTVRTLTAKLASLSLETHCLIPQPPSQALAVCVWPWQASSGPFCPV